MKKRKILLTSFLAAGVFALAGCSFLSNLFGGNKDKGEVIGEDQPAATITTINPKNNDGKINLEFEGGTSSEQLKIFKLVNGGAVTALGKVQLPGVTNEISCISDAPMALSVNTNYQGIELKWQIDKTQAAFNNITKVTDNYAILEFNFPKKGEAAREFKMKLVGIKYNECQMKAGQALEYTFNVLPLDKNYESLTIKEIMNVKDGKFDMIDYNQNSPYFWGNDELQEDGGHGYHYVTTYGEVVYAAPDGNWGLLQDGEDIIEFYSGAGARSFKKEHWPHFEVGKKVAISGNLSQYQGNIQLGFVTAIDELPSGITVQDAAKNYAKLEASDLANITVSGGYHKQVVPGMMNSLKYVVGTVVGGSWKDQNGNAISAFDSGARCVFDVQVGDQKLTVAYDYHLTGGHNPIDDDYTNAIRKMFNDAFNSSGELRFMGTMRYNTASKNVFTLDGNEGHYELVPFEVDHISTKTGDPNKGKGGLFGCKGSVVGTSGVVAIVSLLGTGLILSKKKED